MKHRRPKLSVRESQQKYKHLYGNPDKRPGKIILRKNTRLKSLTLLPLWVASFLCGFFLDLTRIEPLSVPWLSMDKVKYLGWTLSSQEPTKFSQIFLVIMFPRPQIHRRIQGQKFLFHFNPLATQLKPFQRH